MAIDRAKRTLLRSFAAGGAVMLAAAAGIVPIFKKWVNKLRPPGALDEDDFLARCIKCGQCVQVCPVEAIKLADWRDGYGIGAPYIDARTQACDFSCDVLQCILSCPTGALNHVTQKKEQVRSGLAKLKTPDTCLAVHAKGFQGSPRGPSFKGLHRYEKIDRWNPIPINQHKYDLEICDLCVRECPIEGAISLQPINNDPTDKRRKPVITDSCVGCGTCEMICPIEPSCIEIEVFHERSLKA